MPLLQKPSAGFAIVLEPNLERDALEELADELSKSWVEEIREAFPNGEVGLSVPLKPAERLARYLEYTPGDDIFMLMQPNYVENVRLGLTNPPESPYWNRLITELPKAAEQNIGDFMRLLRESDINF